LDPEWRKASRHVADLLKIAEEQGEIQAPTLRLVDPEDKDEFDWNNFVTINIVRYFQGNKLVAGVKACKPRTLRARELTRHLY